jgi:hypothetical protein
MLEVLVLHDGINGIDDEIDLYYHYNQVRERLVLVVVKRLLQ